MTATADQELVFAGPAALAELVRSREVKPRELVEICLTRIEALNPLLNAFRTTMPEEALAAADAATGSDGPLAGVPIAVKDDTPVAGQVRTRGSRSHGPPETADAEAVRRLRAAGAIPIGITNVPELMIFPWTATDANGVTRNPWDPNRTPGGSSGGSASAVAAGMVPVATASDGGGSIRIPAGACGLVGMKPTRGRVSTMPSADGWLGLSTLGSLTRTVADSALMLDAMHGPDPGDTYAAPPFEGSYAEAAAAQPGRLRIAMSRKIPPGTVGKVSPDQRGAYERTGSLLSELGHDVIERDPPLRLIQLEFVQLWLRGIYEDSLTIPDRSRMEPQTRQMAAAGGRLIPPRRRDALMARRTQTTARMLGLWSTVDVLITPGLATTAIRAQGGLRAIGAGGDRPRRKVHAVHRGLQRHRPAGHLDPGRVRRRRPAAQRAAGGAARRRAHSVLARGADRAGPALGRAPPTAGLTRGGAAPTRPAGRRRSAAARRPRATTSGS